MKISIWQQHSSNHSSEFAIVGRFADSESAKQAFDKLASIVKSIQAWRHAHRDRNEYFYQFAKPTPPEYKVANEYNIEWEFAIDWLRSDPTESIDRFNTDIFIETDGETWNLPSPIQNLFKAMGVQTIITQGTHEPDLKANISCKLPLKGRDSIIETIKRFALTYMPDSKYRGFEYIPWAELKPNRTYFWDFAAHGNVSVDEDMLNCNDMEFSHIGIGLPPMLKWLRDQGCTDIEYTFEESK